MIYKILVINPGSTSTKISIYNDTTELLKTNIEHSKDELAKYPNISWQLEYRCKMILDWIDENDYSPKDFHMISARGGLLKPIESGTYRINQSMLRDLESAEYGEHASNLGARLAHKLASPFGIECCIADPTVSDELQDVARLTGHPLLERKSKYHALNQKAVAKKTAKEIGKRYEECNFVVAHLGGGITIGAHHKGRVIDVNNGLDGEGPFSPERAGTLPREQLIEMCFSDKYSKYDMKTMFKGNGGVVAYLGTSDMREVEVKALDNDKRAALIFRAMAYQISKEIGAYATVLNGCVDSIIITGGIAYSEYMINLIKEKVCYIAPVVIIPGSDENQALAEAAYGVLIGESEIKEYI